MTFRASLFKSFVEIFYLQQFWNLQDVGSDLKWARKQQNNDADEETRKETKVFMDNEAETL